LNNYDVCNASILGRYEERNVGDKEPATDAHNSVADETAITTDQLREMTNELENLTPNRQQEFTGILMKYQGRIQ
jgi:hypothetical protein